MESTQQSGLYIGGHWRPASPARVRAVLDPSSELAVGSMAMATLEELDAALQAAQQGFELWRHTGTWERAAKLRRVSELLRGRAEDLSVLMSRETGKPIAESRGEWSATADQFEWYGEETKRIYGQLLDGRQAATRLAVIYQPVGVVAAFSAWNFPALLPARKIAAALAAGCAIIIKPAGEAPMSCMAVVQACHDAGLPEGAVNLVTGDSAQIAEHLLASPIVRKVSLTGSVPVGKRVYALASRGVKRISMELGGHAPVVVFASADVEQAAVQCATFKFRNCGQVCISPTRFYVEESAYQPFVEAFVRTTQQLVLGPGTDPRSTMGPMANARGLAGATEMIRDALERGAQLLTGGGRPAHLTSGYFLEPTVLGRVPDEARIMREEPFAPVAPIASFCSRDEVIARANALPFGLAGYVFSNDLANANHTAEALEVGMVGVNDMMLATAEMPFGGVKESGMGREGGSLGILDYLQPKYIKTRYLG